MNPHAIFDIIGQAPNLAGAACAGRHDIFELPPATKPDYGSAIAVAVAMCRRCPVLGQCRRYLDSLPPAYRPDDMVFAARVLTKPARRRKAG